MQAHGGRWRDSTLARIGVLACALALGACTTTTTRSSGEIVSTTQKSDSATSTSRGRARVELAAGYYRNGQRVVALEEAKRAVQVDPTLADAYGLLGLIYMDLDDRRAAEENFQRALQRDGNNPDLNNNYGWFLCQTGRERGRSAISSEPCAIRCINARARQQAPACA
jgi:type IV pilus assembly protein PilF